MIDPKRMSSSNEKTEESYPPEKEIIVFTTSGRTFIFKRVTNFSYNSIGFSFDYTGVSTGKTRHAEFFYDGTSGYAITDM
jgi:hypothetical protein